jgi:hypothetical protein
MMGFDFGNDRRDVGISSDVDKNLGSAFIVVPIALMAVMLNKRMML